MLAMNSIGIMPGQAADLARIINLISRQRNRAQQAEEKGQAQHHNDHRQHPAPWAFHQDVAIAGCGQTGDSEIECIHIALDAWIGVLLQYEDKLDLSDCV